jgi:hypothetical protein
MLIRKALQDINGPDLHVCITVGESGLRTVHLSFDASKFPYQIKCGIPENHVSFAGTSLLSLLRAKIQKRTCVLGTIYLRTVASLMDGIGDAADPSLSPSPF